MNNVINPSSDIFHSLKKKDNTIILSYLKEEDDESDCHDDDMEYLSLVLYEYEFKNVKNVKIIGKEADNYVYEKGMIDINSRKVDLTYRGVNYSEEESFYSFSFEYEELKMISSYKIDSPCC